MKEFEVVQTLRKWFEHQGYTVAENIKVWAGNRLDLAAKSEQDDWYVEVKGDYDANAAQYNVNFDTGMGQLLKSITLLNGRAKYAVGIPFSRTERGEKLSYSRILPKYAKSLAFEALNIHMLLVRDDKSVEVIAPSEMRDFLASINKMIQRDHGGWTAKQAPSPSIHDGTTERTVTEDVYVVYVNHPTSAATVHSINCGIYQNRKANTTRNGYWKASFPHPKKAQAFASSTGKKNLRICSKCT